MKVLAEFVDQRNDKRYGPGDGNKIDPALDSDQVTRLKKAGCLADGEESAPLKPEGSTAAKIPASQTEMRTEEGERAARAADAQTRDHAQHEAVKASRPGLDQSHGDDDDGLAGRTKRHGK
jgi:hypothetical protein